MTPVQEEQKPAVLLAKAATIDHSALLYHLEERYSKPGAPAKGIISGATDTEIRAELTYTDDTGKERTVAGVGGTILDAINAMRAELTKPVEEPKVEEPKPKVRRARAAGED